jgi:hypothetical protein
MIRRYHCTQTNHYFLRALIQSFTHCSSFACSSYRLLFTKCLSLSDYTTIVFLVNNISKLYYYSFKTKL